MKYFRMNKLISMVMAISMIIVSLSFAVGAVENDQITIEKLQYSTRLMSVITQAKFVYENNLYVIDIVSTERIDLDFYLELLLK